MAVVPNERALTVEQMRASTRTGQLRLLALVDGEVVGSANTGLSDLPDAAFVAPRVIPSARRHGVGTELLRALSAHAVTLGVTYAQANVDDPGSLAFAIRFGFVEVDRQVEQVRAIGVEPTPTVPAEVTIVPIAERPLALARRVRNRWYASVPGHGLGRATRRLARAVGDRVDSRPAGHVRGARR